MNKGTDSETNNMTNEEQDMLKYGNITNSTPNKLNTNNNNNINNNNLDSKLFNNTGNQLNQPNVNKYQNMSINNNAYHTNTNHINEKPNNQNIQAQQYNTSNLVNINQQ